MTDIQFLVTQASDPTLALEKRHHAFSKIVDHYRNMAYGCAYAVLGDFDLAEDVAQEAFVLAWQKIESLRNPQAFASWLHHLVLTQCNRRTRKNQLSIVSLEEADNVTFSQLDPPGIVEQIELRDCRQSIG